MDRRVISKTKQSDLSTYANLLGAGLSGFASGYHGNQLAEQQKQNNTMVQSLMQGMFGQDGQGGGIVQAQNPAINVNQQETQEMARSMAKPSLTWTDYLRGLMG